MKPIQVEGRNPVLEMLRRGITITELFIDSHARLDKKLEEILALARKNKTKIKKVERSTLDKMSATGVYMGLIAYATAPPLPLKRKKRDRQKSAGITGAENKGACDHFRGRKKQNSL